MKKEALILISYSIFLIISGCNSSELSQQEWAQAMNILYGSPYPQNSTYSPSQSCYLERGLRVTTISPSVSTSMEARDIRSEWNYLEVDLSSAEALLVVVRSTLSNPLNYSYKSLQLLESDAESLFNISGLYFHIYIYRPNNMNIIQVKHCSYEASG